MSARILRTRSGRELRRIESTKKVKKEIKRDVEKVEVKKSPNDSYTRRSVKITESQPIRKKQFKNKYESDHINTNTDIKDNKFENAQETEDPKKSQQETNVVIHQFMNSNTNVPNKRKRGRPRKSEQTCSNQSIDKDINYNISNDVLGDVSPRKKKILVTTEKKCTIQTDHFQRKPRMASLNALAKVNAVLECYRTESKKELQEHIREIDKKCLENEDKISTGNKTFSSKLLYLEELEENVFKEIDKVDKATRTFDLIKDLQNEVAIKNKVNMVDQCTQTEILDCKVTQTDNIMTLYNENTQRLCTCPKTYNNTFPYYAPTNLYDYIVNPIHVKSNILVHSDSHVLAVPIVKKHVSWNKNNVYKKTELTENVSHIVNNCLTNTLMSNSFSCAKLVYLSSYKEEEGNLKKAFNKDDANNLNKSLETNSMESKGLSVPSLYYADILIPTSQLNNNSKSNEKIRTPKTSKRKREKEVTKILKSQRSNGWVFEGTAVEERVKQNEMYVTRKYYPALKRNHIELKIHDAVILKSGVETEDYVARIAALWEDDEGIYSDDMMMSVFWYYKPDQTNGKTSDIKGEQMEVFASRHQDDNSVACIVDRCYVVSFPQFCRFRAQQLMSTQKRKQKTTAVVPESRNNRSRFIPSPDTDPLLVYFCRHGYDYRSGKIIKSV